jgi:hypothetical protein
VSSDEMIWEDPVQPWGSPRLSKYERMFLRIKDYPDRWALVLDTKSRSNSLALERRAQKGVYGEGFEVQVVRAGEHQWKVYARYVTPDGTSVSADSEEDD